MAKQSTQTVERQRAVLTIEQMKSGIRRLQKRIDDLEALDPTSVQKFWSPEVQALQKAIDGTLVAVFGHNTLEYDRYYVSLENGYFRMMGVDDMPLHEVRQSLAESKKRAIVSLQQAIRGLEEEIAEQETLVKPVNAKIETEHDLTKVFIVHGHDEGAREAVARFLEYLGLKPIILHERPNKGRTIITKFREEAAEVGFAVVLLTPDDTGGPVPLFVGRPKFRARQNVIFELGFFIGALGLDRVAALIKGDIERPSDFDGVVYISLDNGTWKTELSRELDAAGYEIDWNKVMRG